MLNDFGRTCANSFDDDDGTDEVQKVTLVFVALNKKNEFNSIKTKTKLISQTNTFC